MNGAWIESPELQGRPNPVSEHLKKISIGRYIEIQVDEAEDDEIKENIQTAIDKLLYNSIIEDYEVIYE